MSIFHHLAWVCYSTRRRISGNQNVLVSLSSQSFLLKQCFKRSYFEIYRVHFSNTKRKILIISLEMIDVLCYRICFIEIHTRFCLNFVGMASAMCFKEVSFFLFWWDREFNELSLTVHQSCSITFLTTTFW